MKRRHLALLFFLYSVAAVAIGLVEAILIYRVVNLETIGFAIGTGFLVYMMSGVVPFAIWGARGFRAANWASLFIPWAVLAVGLVILFLIQLERVGPLPAQP